MKKSLFALLALLLCVAMFFTSCATKPEVVTPVTPVEPDLPVNPPTGVGDYMLASGGAAGFAGLALFILKKKRYKLGI